LKEKIINTRFKKIRKIVFRTLLVLIILFLLLGIALTLPYVQTKIAQHFTEQINNDYKTDINVERVEVNLFGGVQLKGVYIRDEKKDTLIFANRISTSILDVNKLINGKLFFGGITANDLVLNIKTYKGDKDTNLDKFIAAFDDGKPASGKFRMTSDHIILKNCRFREIDYNRDVPLDVDFSKINGRASDFKIIGPNVYTNIDKISFLDHRGLFVNDAKFKFTYTKKFIRFENTDLYTMHSHFIGNVYLRYDRKDFADFNNKVIFDVITKKASISSNDIWYFYKEIGKNQRFDLKGKIGGTLNNLFIKNMRLKDNRNSEIIGDVNFKNLFPRKGQAGFYMKGSFDKLSSSYQNLTTLLPNVLGKSLPTSMKKLGHFTVIGDVELTATYINADFTLNTDLGTVVSKLAMTNINNIDNASYTGNVILDDFDLGTFTNRKDFGRTSFDIDVEGKGFVEKYLDVKFSGEVSKFFYNGYSYKNILADGSFKKPIFQGKVNVNDTNLFLDFDGIVDLSKKENIYDFHAKIDYANLKRLNFIKDSLSVFRGDVVMKVYGRSLNTMKGDVIVTNASYQNPKNLYFFDNLQLNSSIYSDNTRKIVVSSTDGIDGVVEGKFDINQIQNMVKNSLGSLYTNYKPYPIKKGQYMKFNFYEFEKIIEIINPKVSFSHDAVLTGSINADANDFKMDFKSDVIDAFDTHLDKVLLQVDNKNPLYHTYVQTDSIITKYYKIRDFSLINTTANDTLQFRTEFRGGDKGNDFYNLNLYHTIGKQNQHIIGFNKSELMFKDLLWYINEQNNEKNRVVIDDNINSFSFEDVILSHEKQSISLNGLIKGKNTKDLKLTFNEVNLNKVTPDVAQFKFEGELNGDVYIKQDESVYQPTANLEIKNLLINDNELGTLALNIKGDEDFRKFDINSTINNQHFNSLTANGNLSIVADETFLDVDVDFQKFNLGVLSNLGGDVLNNIRGFVSGNARINGNVKNIDYKGTLFVDDAGLTIPYLNVDYKISPKAQVNVSRNRFDIPSTVIFDSKHNTKGNLSGAIKHKEFGDWELDLNISSNRLLALDTEYHEDAAYYGVAYVNGSATIKGPTSGLTIDVNAKSEKGTDIKIPINDADAVEENKYIHFLSEAEKYNQTKKATEVKRDYNGLQMNFEFEITPIANIEVILNRESGHGMKGRGAGNLNMNINTLGKFEMTGDFQVWEGSYNFKYGGVIDKQFTVKKFGSIVWDGDPYKAQLNLEAVSKNITANPDVLTGTTSVNKKTPVEVVIGLKGTVLNPEPDFTINFPNVSNVLKAEIDAKLTDPATRQTQALYLLSTGGFLSPEGMSQAQYTNFAFERVSALFGDLFNDNSGKMQIGMNYVQSDKSSLNPTDSRLVATISTTVNERITINGKVGVPVGGVNESAIVGNVEVKYRVNEDGTLNLRVFNKENDITYIGQGIGYTQGVGVSYEVDFDTFKEFVNRIFTKNKLDKEKNTVIVDPNDNPLPENTSFKNKEKKDKAPNTTKVNQEGVLQKE
jgi:hypothetical protein